MDLVVNLPNIFVTKQYRAEGDWLLLDARKHRKGLVFSCNFISTFANCIKVCLIVFNIEK